MIGSNIENYKIISLLGEGGMGIVYRAFDLKLERYVALKILSAQATMNPQFIERFKREAKHQANLNHTNIVPVYGFAEQNGLLGIVMEYIEGETLEKLIERKGRLQLLESLLILKQILLGVAYAHKKGFVHRDIKPSNVIINTEETIKIMDFGISKSLNELHGITKTGTKIGTILYMSPEQIKAQEPTAQSDIYSIGITFYEMLAGKTPFDSGTEFEIMEAHLKKSVPRLSATYSNINPEADKIIQKALAKQLNKRYLSCEEILADVNALIDKLQSDKKKKAEKKKSVLIKEPGHEKNKFRFFIFAFFFIVIFGTLAIYFFKTAQEFFIKSLKKTNQGVVIEDATPGTLIKFRKVDLNSKSSFSSICFTDDSVGIACGSLGTIARTNNGGSTWFSISDTVSGNLNSVAFATPGRGFIVGDNGVLLSTSDTGINWNRIETGYKNSFFNISFLDKNTGFIIGTSGLVLITLNGGDEWKSISTYTNENLFGLYINPVTKDLYIVGWNGQFLKSTDLGSNWIINTKISEKYLRSIVFTDENSGFAVGGAGEILKTNDAGKSWDVIKSNVYSGLMNIRFRNINEGVIVGSKGEILYSSDGGSNWNLIPTGIFYSLSDAVYKKNGKIFITGFNGTLLTN